MPFFPPDGGPQPGSHCAKDHAEEDAPSVRDGPPGARAGRPPAPGSEPEKGEDTNWAPGEHKGMAPERATEIQTST